jgi:hypothetical protein
MTVARHGGMTPVGDLIMVMIKLTSKLLSWVVTSFFYAVVFGSVVWFAGHVFGADWVYWTFIRKFFIGMLVIDLVVMMYRIGTREVS